MDLKFRAMDNAQIEEIGRTLEVADDTGASRLARERYDLTYALLKREEHAHPPVLGTTDYMLDSDAEPFMPSSLALSSWAGPKQKLPSGWASRALMTYAGRRCCSP
jgi:hypothetical protein